MSVEMDNEAVAAADVKTEEVAEKKEEGQERRKGGCCCCHEDKYDDEVPDCKFVEAEDRGCQDTLFLLGFIGGCVLFVSIYLGLTDPSVTRVLYGNDWAGNVCGEGDFEDQPVAVWPSLIPGTSQYLIKFCAADCNASLSDPLMITPYESTEYLGYCLPLDLDTLTAYVNGSEYGDMALDFSTGITDAVSDVFTARWLILGSLFFAVLVSFIYGKCIGTVGACIVYFLTLSFLILGAASGYFLLDFSESAYASGDENAQYYEYGAYTVWGLTFLLLCLLCVIRKKIQMALAIMSSAGKSIADMPLLFLVPFIPFVVSILYLLLWCVVAVSIVSISNPVEYDLPSEFAFNSNWDVAEGTFIDMEYDEAQNTNFGYVFFHLLWFTQFLVYLNYLVIAGAIAKWYFLPVDAASGKKTTVPDGYVQGSLHRTCRYNLGSVAFGSFVLAVVKFIHACITYLEAKAKEIRGEPNAAEKVLMAIVHCCMTCVECCLDKISRNAYCWIAAWGGSFLGGSCGTFKLFLDSENMVRAAAMSYTSNILLFVGKTFVACFTTAVASAILSYAYTSLSSILLPTVLIFLFSMFVGEIFMLELEVAVDVIFLCFCVDLKTHNGSIKYGTSEIKSMFDQAVDDHKAQNMTQADRDEAAKKGSVQ